MAYIKPTQNQTSYSASISNKIAPPKYTGKETDTMEIIVNNERATIEGNVKWKSFLGETEDKAFPGNKGLEHHEQILALMRGLNAEIKRSTQVDEVLSDLIDAISKRSTKSIDDFTKELSELSDSLAQYAAHVSRLEASISGAIEDAVAPLEASIQNEIADRKTNDDSLTRLISGETIRARMEEDKIKANVDGLSERVDTAEESLSTISSSIGSILNEASDELYASIEDEVTARYNADREIMVLIDSIRESINSISTRLSTMSYNLNTLSDNTSNDIESLSISLNDKITEEQKERQREDMEIKARMREIEDSNDALEASFSSLNNVVNTSIVDNDAYISGMDIRLTSRVNDMSDTLDTFYQQYNESFAEVTEEVDSKIQPLKDDINTVVANLSAEIERSSMVDVSLQTTTSQLDSKIDGAIKQSEEEIAYVWNATTEWIKEVEESVADSKEIIESIDLIDGGNAPVLH